MTLPTSTYRLQFRNGMTFERATALIPYLKRLGVSHLYASPIFAAVGGSTHGYDVTDYARIDPELGGREGFDRMAASLRGHGIGLIIDIVPNHMAASLENRWWRSAIEWGAQSPYAAHFDIDWEQKLTLPILNESLEQALANEAFSLTTDPTNGYIALAYGEQNYPLYPASYRSVFGHGADVPADFLELSDNALAAREENFHLAMRHYLAGEDRARIDKELQRVTRDLEQLRRIIEEQPFVPIPWRQAPKGLSYRRFFEVTGLVGVRVESPNVFDDVHAAVLDLVEEGLVQGLRIDHIDGLSYPKAYLERLRERVGPDIHLTVEKILGPEERLPEAWPVSGTTGYEFIASLAAVMTDETGLPGLDRAYRAVHSGVRDVSEELRVTKSLMVDRNFEGEVQALVTLALALYPATGSLEDIHKSLHSALRAVLVAFPVYRTYGDEAGLSAIDAQLLDGSVAQASLRLPPDDFPALGFIADLLGGKLDHSIDDKVSAFRRRFQQLTGPLMAKAAEDTLFFRHLRLLADNEVGSDLAAPIRGVDAFHGRMAERQKRQPEGLSTTSTHDTKRGEDARARLFTITEAPEAWAAASKRWRNQRHAPVIHLPDGPAPEPEIEWMIHQALLAHWPPNLSLEDTEGLAAFGERMTAFLEKSLREAKLRSNWEPVGADYEKAVTNYAASLLAAENAPFRADFSETIRPYIHAGMLNSLTQTLIKLTAPGIPDIYQGAEGWDFSFVDPDNRREPDFDWLAQSIGEVGEPLPFDNPEALRDGSLKQRMVATCLHLRNKLTALFEEGAYVPLVAEGSRRNHVLAFARVTSNAISITVVTRLHLAIAAEAAGTDFSHFWGDTRIVLPPALRNRHFRDAFCQASVETGKQLAIARVLADRTVALLIAED